MAPRIPRPGRKRSGNTEPADPARLEAWRLLGRIRNDRAFLARLGRIEASGADRRGATEIAAGVTRWRRRLDFLIDALTGGGHRVEEGVRRVLQIGLLDLLILRTPAHAAVHEAVNLARQAVRPGAAGFVNAVLRTAQRLGPALPEPDTGDPVEDLAIRHSHPTWLVRRWIEAFGADDTLLLLHANNAAPVHTLRVDTRRFGAAAVGAQLAENGLDVQPGRYLEDALRVRALQPVRESGLLDSGAVTVQDEAAMLVVRMLDPRPGESLLDACAAPGGKTLYAADRMQNQGRIVAVDAHSGKLALLAAAARRRGLDIVETVVGDATSALASDAGGPFDAVLVDAPCSGTGVLAKRADLRWNRTPEQVNELRVLQARLLDAAADRVRPGGRLVYATCSIEREENEDQVLAFLRRDARFRVESAPPSVPSPVIGTDGFLHVFPHRHGLDGAFAARLRRVPG